MAYKCRICGVNEVLEPDGVCEYCEVSQDPYLEAVSRQHARPRPVITGTADQENSGQAASGGRHRRILINGGSELTNSGNLLDTEDGSSTVQVFQHGQTPVAPPVPSPASQSSAKTASGKTPLTSGITKNIQVDTQNRGFWEKCFFAVFEGTPFLLDNQITMFQVFPDYSGTALNAQGNACDQVIVYGTLNAGAVSENNEVDVFGRRDSRNNVVAKEIRNKASGTIIRPSRVIPAWVVRIMVFSLLAVLFGILAGLGVQGILQIAVLVFCLLNLPLVIQVVGAVLGVFFSLLRQIFR